MMKIHGYNKPIKLYRLISKGDWRNRTFAIEWLPSEQAIGCCTKNDIIELTTTPRKFNDKLFGTLTDNATLFFDKSATFPRYKLEGSGYKRCIKVDKADFIVVGKTEPKSHYNSWFMVYEDNDYLYVGYRYNDDATNRNAFNSIGLYPKLIYNDSAVVYPPDAQILLATNPPKPLIWDTDLDKKINTSLPAITESDVKQILAMLSSNDSSIVDLGLKTLASYDVTSRPMTTMRVLMINNKWTSCSSSTSVAVETMLTSLGITLNHCRYHHLKSRLSWINQIKDINEEDRVLAKLIMRTCIQELIDKEIEPYRRTFESENMSFKITVNVEG